MLNLLEFLDINDIRLPKITGRQPERVFPQIKEGDMERLFRELYRKKTLYGLASEVCYYGALRLKELIGMKRDNLGLDKWQQNPSEPCELKITKDIAKNKRERTVLIPSETALKICQYMTDIEEGNLKSIRVSSCTTLR